LTLTKVREFDDPLPPRNNFGDAVAFWKTDRSLEAPINTWSQTSGSAKSYCGRVVLVGGGTLTARRSTISHLREGLWNIRRNSIETLKADRNDLEQRGPEAAADFIERVRVNQRKLTAELISD